MAKHVFLSEDWFSEIRRLQAAHSDVAPAEIDIRMNLTITGTPFGADRPMHMITASGQAEWGEHHVPDADVTLTLEYGTAKEIFVGGNPQAAIEAFMAGKIIMQGDLTKLMTMQAAPPGPGAPALAEALLEMTE